MGIGSVCKSVAGKAKGAVKGAVKGGIEGFKTGGLKGIIPGAVIGGGTSLFTKDGKVQTATQGQQSKQQVQNPTQVAKLVCAEAGIPGHESEVLQIATAIAPKNIIGKPVLTANAIGEAANMLATKLAGGGNSIGAKVNISG